MHFTSPNLPPGSDLPKKEADAIRAECRRTVLRDVPDDVLKAFAGGPPKQLDNAQMAAYDRQEECAGPRIGEATIAMNKRLADALARLKLRDTIMLSLVPFGVLVLGLVLRWVLLGFSPVPR